MTMYTNLFKAMGSKVHCPFEGAKRLYLILSRRDRTVRVRSRRSSSNADFSWALPTNMSASGLNGLTQYCAMRAAELDGDATPEERYALERDVSSRIWGGEQHGEPL